MSKFTRRNFLKASGGAAIAASAMSISPFAIGGASKKVVVVGGAAKAEYSARHQTLTQASTSQRYFPQEQLKAMPVDPRTSESDAC